MTTFRKLIAAAFLTLMTCVGALADDPPVEPPPVCGHMDTGKCGPTSYTQTQTSDTNGGNINMSEAFSVTDAALSILGSVLPLV